ncbi:hypothetical protein EES43_08770 [Streptomyces sp. ADI96-02]|uniref:hypothetical protein n=1 Tax=Streptomyces sp. ADI96-02 TaxID=1522760 RepID=UPI000F9286BF|nr:hypothetical protein [Streptomyces sp. ADI96-02]RPK64985.1 hypothetical protein EES43_08770 [Streptomyces sp. ADI96-02]
MKLARRLIATGAAAAACIAAVVTAAHADDARDRPAAALAEELPPYAVEDFAYPQADKIKAEFGIVLKRGDGHITLADCATGEGFLEVYSRTSGRLCFRVTGKTGYLSLEIPAVFGVKSSAAHQTDMTLTTEGDEQNVTAAKNEWKGVGQATDPQGRDYALVELSTSA